MKSTLIIGLLTAALVIPALAAIDVPPLPDPHAGDQIYLGPILIGGIGKMHETHYYGGYYETTNEVKPLAGFGGHFDYHFGSMFYKTRLYGGVIFTDNEIIFGEWNNHYGICFTTGKFRPYIMPGAGIKVAGDQYSTTTSFVGSLLFGMLFKPNQNFTMVLEGGYKGITNDVSYGLIRNLYDFKVSEKFGLRCGFDLQSELSDNAHKLEAKAYFGPNFFF